MWPVQWASATAPPDGSSRYSSTRFLLDTDLLQTGTWEVCLEILYEEWQQTHYQGSVTVNFMSSTPLSTSFPTSRRDTKTITPTSKTKDAFSYNFNSMTVALSVFGVGILIAVIVGLAFRSALSPLSVIDDPRNRVASTQTVTTHRSKSSSRFGPLAGAASDTEDEASMAPIRRKKRVDEAALSPVTPENLNPMLDEESPPSSLTSRYAEPEPTWSSIGTPPSPPGPGRGTSGGISARGMLSSMTSAKPSYARAESRE